MPLIELSDITRMYKMGDTELKAVNDVSLSIEAGDFVAIMGPSGSGKSTLMHTIGLLDRPTDGVYMLNGKPTQSLSKRKLARIRNKTIGFVFQTFNLLPKYKALANVVMPTLYGSKHRNPKQYGLELLKMVGLEHRANHKSNELSGGEQQRIAIARALINDPEIILADEPTGNLDSKSGASIMELFKKLNKQGTTVVVVTHADDIAAYAHRVIRMRDGTILSDERRKS